MNKPKVDVYVFGAGASVHVGSPLTKDFVSEGVNLLCASDIYDISQESFYKVVELIDILYNTNIASEIEKANKEELIYSDQNLILESVSIEELLQGYVKVTFCYYILR